MTSSRIYHELSEQLAFWCSGRFSQDLYGWTMGHCQRCGNTGDAIDDATGWWATPMEPCHCCNGTGEHDV